MVILIILAFWQIIAYMTPPIFFSTPISTLEALFDIIRSGELTYYVSTTFQAYIVGFLLAIGVGIPFGILVGYFPSVRKAMEPYISAAYATPRVTIIPLMVIWFGIGFWSRICYIFLSSIFPCIMNVIQGVAYTNEELLETGRAFCANQRQMMMKIVIPNAIPYIAIGVRLAAVRAMIGVITAEMFLQAVGLGGAILRYGDIFRTDRLLALVVVVSLIATTLSIVSKKVEERLTLWRASS